MPVRGSRNEIRRYHICLLLQDLRPCIDRARMGVADYDEVSAQLGGIALDRYVRRARMRELVGVRMGGL
jgi:hypothetical protein